MKYVRRYRWAIAGGGVALLVLAFVAFRPDKLFIDDVVDESLEDAFAVPASDDPTGGDPPPQVAAPEPVDRAPSGDESPMPDADAVGSPPAPGAAASDGAVSDLAGPDGRPAGPVSVTTGGFYGIDHSASGTATVYEQGGRYVLRFEDDTDIQNGPDLWVWLLADGDYPGGDPDQFLDLGRIKGNVGGQNYELPAEFDPEVHRAVLIWCLRFGVPFAAAPLA